MLGRTSTGPSWASDMTVSERLPETFFSRLTFLFRLVEDAQHLHGRWISA